MNSYSECARTPLSKMLLHRAPKTTPLKSNIYKYIVLLNVKQKKNPKTFTAENSSGGRGLR